VSKLSSKTAETGTGIGRSHDAGDTRTKLDKFTAWRSGDAQHRCGELGSVRMEWKASRFCLQYLPMYVGRNRGQVAILILAVRVCDTLPHQVLDTLIPPSATRWLIMASPGGIGKPSLCSNTLKHAELEDPTGGLARHVSR
jgi:hypothetical protein